MLTRRQFIKMSQTNIEKADLEQLADLQLLQIDLSLPKANRLEVFLKYATNPYCFRYGNTKIKLEFTSEAPSFQELFTQFLIRRKDR